MAQISTITVYSPVPEAGRGPMYSTIVLPEFALIPGTVPRFATDPGTLITIHKITSRLYGSAFDGESKSVNLFDLL